MQNVRKTLKKERSMVIFSLKLKACNKFSKCSLNEEKVGEGKIFLSDEQKKRVRIREKC